MIYAIQTPESLRTILDYAIYHIEHNPENFTVIGIKHGPSERIAYFLVRYVGQQGYRFFPVNSDETISNQSYSIHEVYADLAQQFFAQGEFVK